MNVLEGRSTTGGFDTDTGMPVRMSEAARGVWLAALERGDYNQSTGKLFKREENGYCCLGLFAKLQGCTFEPRLIPRTDSFGRTIGEYESDDVKVLSTDEHGDAWDVNESELLLQAYADQFEISNFQQSVLSRLNDGTTTTIYKSDREYANKVAFWRQMDCVQETVNESATSITFHPKPHSFAEIAAVIRKHF
jgi:hypothetical protein